MAKPPPARWAVDPKTVKATVAADGTFTLSCTVLDNGVPLLTPTLKITAARAVRLDVHGEPGAQITDYRAYTDIVTAAQELTP